MGYLPLFTYIYHKNQANVGKYAIQYMDGMGYENASDHIF